jgi:hypothetical protein
MAIPSSGGAVGSTSGDGVFSSVDLFFADARLYAAVANHVRYRAIQKVFGVEPEQVNLLTFVLALTLANGAAGVAKFVLQPIHVSGSAAGTAAVLLREGAYTVAGPTARQIPGFGSLALLALAGGLALPHLRRAAAGARAAEHRVRLERERRYAEARRAMRRET